MLPDMEPRSIGFMAEWLNGLFVYWFNGSMGHWFNGLIGPLPLTQNSKVENHDSEH